MTFHFYNPGWGVRGGENFGTFDGDLKRVLDAGSIYFGFRCTLVCSRAVSASIARKSAKKLGLKNGDLEPCAPIPARSGRAASR